MVSQRIFSAEYGWYIILRTIFNLTSQSPSRQTSPFLFLIETWCQIPSPYKLRSASLLLIDEDHTADSHGFQKRLLDHTRGPLESSSCGTCPPNILITGRGCLSWRIPSPIWTTLSKGITQIQPASIGVLPPFSLWNSKMRSDKFWLVSWKSMSFSCCLLV